jgi:hypothetical protein
MAQEFTIKSEAIESKINSLLPSQGGFGAGIDFSASTMVIPIVDLTETAEGSGLRQDLQTALSLTSADAFDINNTTTTIINTTGYFRVTGTFTMRSDVSAVQNIDINMTDGFTTKKIYGSTSTNGGNTYSYDFDKVFVVKAGESISVTASAQARFIGSSRQLADINGNLTNP